MIPTGSRKIVVNVELNAPENRILRNPSKGELQAHFDLVSRSQQSIEPEDNILRGLVTKDGTQHTWGNAWTYDHGNLYDHGKHGPNVALLVNPRGVVVDANHEEPYVVPGIGSKLQPAKKFVANAIGFDGKHWPEDPEEDEDEFRRPMKHLLNQ